MTEWLVQNGDAVSVEKCGRNWGHFEKILQLMLSSGLGGEITDRSTANEPLSWTWFGKRLDSESSLSAIRPQPKVLPWSAKDWASCLLKAKLESHIIMEGSDFHLVLMSPKILIVFLVSAKVPRPSGIPVQDIPSITLSFDHFEPWDLGRSLLDHMVPPVTACTLPCSVVRASAPANVCVCVRVCFVTRRVTLTSCWHFICVNSLCPWGNPGRYSLLPLGFVYLMQLLFFNI